MVTLYLKKGSRLLKEADSSIPGDLWPRVKRIPVERTRDIPRDAHLVLQFGTAKPPVELEWWATHKGAWLVCLPEASDFLADRVRVALEDDADLTILDGSLQKLVA